MKFLKHVNLFRMFMNNLNLYYRLKSTKQWKIADSATCHHVVPEVEEGEDEDGEDPKFQKTKCLSLQLILCEKLSKFCENLKLFEIKFEKNK